MSEEPESITLAEAAERLDVHYMTAYRWVRTGLLDAWKEGGQWRVDGRDLRAPDRRPAGRRPAEQDQLVPDDLAAVAERLAGRLLLGDEPAGWQMLEDTLARGLDPALVHVGLIAPAMDFVGRQWESGAIDVAHEHRASATAARLVARLGPAFRRPGPPRQAVAVATVRDDRHGLPVSLLVDILRSRRIGAADLGADAPAINVVGLLGEEGVRVLALCSTTPQPVAAIRREIDVIRSARPEVTILLGGAAIPDKASALEHGADGWTGATAIDAADAIEAALLAAGATR